MTASDVQRLHSSDDTMFRLDDAERLIRDAFGTPVSGTGGTQFVAVSGRDGLRWIIPADLGSASRVLADWRPYKWLSRQVWSALRAASGTGLLARIPGTRTFGVDLRAVAWSDYGWDRPDPPHLVVHVGTPGDHQKLVCLLVDRQTSDGAAIVKFPLAPSATACLKREYATLVQLADEGRDIAPRPLRADAETRFTVQTYVQGRSAGVALGEAHVNFLASLVQPGRRITLEAARNEFQAQRQKLEAAGRLSSSARRTIDSALNHQSWSGDVPLVRSHGDFAPWNLKRCPDGRIRAVDWEDSAADELPYVDLCHYARSVSEQLGRRCAVPWEAYTSALMLRDPQFSADSVGNLRVAAALSYWMRRGCQDEWDADIHGAA